MAPQRLKVFQAQFGFYDTVVAAPSQVAALRAWGTHQNLFANGDATLTTDEAAIAAALEHPETPLRRPVGSSDPFTLEPTALPKLPDAPKRKKAAPAIPRRSSRHATREAPPPDRSTLNAAEADLQKLEEARKREEADLRDRQDELDRERATAQAAYVAARKAAKKRVVVSRNAYLKAGGRN
jgi:hypothetical protein